MSEDSEMCAIPGAADAPLTRGEFNRLVSQVRYYHLRPLRDEIKDLKHMLIEQDRVMTGHIETDKAFFNQLKGAKWALYLIVAILAPIVPTIYYLIKALNTAGVL